MTRSAEGLAADFAALTSGTGAVASWIATANDVLQLVATGIAIVAGLYAIKWHRVRIKNAKEKANDQSNRRTPRPAPRDAGEQPSIRDEDVHR
jgi:hypothetical protein